jgi:hypothetical protein
MHDSLTAALACDATTLPASMLYTSGHRPALFTDTSVVRGAPGTGKSLWVRVLTDPALRAVAADAFQMPRLKTARTVIGHSAEPGPHQPTTEELEELTGEGIQPVTLWTTVALNALGVTDLTSLPDWRERIAWLVRNPDAPRRAVAALDTETRASNVVHLIVFDALERLHPDQREADRLASGILCLAADLSRISPRVRAKVFIRPDMLDAALPALAPAARRVLRTAELDWSWRDHFGAVSGTGLYGLLFHLLGNHDSPEAATFRAMTPGWRQTPHGHFTAPEPLLWDSAAQERLFTTLADPYMGAHARMGRAYRCLPNCLQDASGALTPRPFLTALKQAVSHATERHPAHTRALHHEDIRLGWRAGAHARVTEIEDAMPWVRAALEPLTGQWLPIHPDHVVALWAQASLSDRLRELGARAAVPTPIRYTDLMEALIAAGVAVHRSSGHLDLPDMFRLEHRMGRHGGVKRTRPVT